MKWTRDERGICITMSRWAAHSAFDIRCSRQTNEKRWNKNSVLHVSHHKSQSTKKLHISFLLLKQFAFENEIYNRICVLLSHIMTIVVKPTTPIRWFDSFVLRNFSSEVDFILSFVLAFISAINNLFDRSGLDKYDVCYLFK